MNWRPDRIQAILLLAIFIAGTVLIVSIPLTHALTIFVIAGRIALLLLGVLLMYTGYDNQRRPTEAKFLLFRRDHLIGSGLLLILFVILVSLTSVFQGYIK
jgi:NADH:ubiquinone oxidoreductase subunit 6 (subunit J)